MLGAIPKCHSRMLLAGIDCKKTAICSSLIYWIPAIPAGMTILFGKVLNSNSR